MEELKLLEESAAAAPVLVTQFDALRLKDYLSLAKNLRAAGIGVEVYPDAKKLGQQLKFADKRGFRIALIAGDQEFERGEVQVKDLQSGEATDQSLADDAAAVVSQVKQLLS